MNLRAFASPLLRPLLHPLLRLTLTALLALPLLWACGGNSSDDDNGLVRLVNASTDHASLDFYASDTRVASAVLQDTASGYVSLAAATTTFKLKRADAGTTALATDRAVASGVSHTLVAYTTGGTLRTAFMSDNQSAPSSGVAYLRVFNTSSEAGSLDVYLTAVGGSLDDVTAITSSLAAERFSSYSEASQGSYRLVVTAAGDKTDLRLDIPSLTLASQQVATLVLTTTPGGVLVHGLLVNQGSNVAAQKNGSARIRLVAGTTGGGTVAATLNGTTLSTALKSPTVSGYTLVPAGSLTANVTVNGSAVAATGLSATPGADLTLMVLGTPAAPQLALLADDNRPSTTSTYARLRLVHGVNGLNAGVTLTADYSAVATDVAYASASTSVGVPASTTYRLEATSPASTAAIYLGTDITLQATHVYTVFALGDASAPLGVLRRDR